MAEQLTIHDDMKLYTTADRFYFEPTINPTEVLVIDRITGEAEVKDINTVKIPIPANAYKPVCGFLGSIKLISGLYLVVAKYRILVGKINGQDIYQLAGTDVIPYSRSTNHLTNKQIEDNNTYERLLKAALETPGIYFSYGYDLTHSMQRLHSVPPDFHKMSLASRADARFLWNGYLLKEYSHQQFSRFALPIIQGFVAINRVTVNGQQLIWTLVSRRSVDRAGTRLFMRGIDAQGNVANFVETEQIVERGGEKSSFVQTRGSIPLYWSQYPNLKYKPAVALSPEDHVAAYTRHLRDQLQRYGNQVLLNLIDQHGKEEDLERGYRAAVAAAALPAVRYEPFDFHAECRGMRYDRLNVLMDRIAHEQTEFGYFLSRGGTVLLRQSGVFRTNCVDCLDRTNVVQSLLARRQLAAVLKLLAVAAADERHPHLDALFNTVWADHADMISVQYSGTGALKTDFTRTGKRTRLGLLRDGINSLTRYYKNNFSDGFRQDTIDLFLGKYVVMEGEGTTVLCPLRRDRDWKYITFPSVLLVAVSMFCASAALPSRNSTEVLLYLMFWGAAVGATLTFIFRHGTEFVDWPRLDCGGLATTLAAPQPPL
ncbi:phosphatidylinositol-3-phosphatase SAC1 [Bicyclus anynana]|uniref:Phosphatidylinositol-3-phosphatase SAC1 n=1 Tax=Bicyclus anynana TaxID=110368 RepID=A0A6J1NM56_BICAN|nr:phosphatidylinositol-3-phosphatase SAC1 [Bicyclus anynana]XP_052744167.1 phosphatidylinositol-3-phosphatase SAC1 [Bicyclus anynana]